MEKSFKDKYFTATKGEFPDQLTVLDKTYVKVEDLRYGTNPHQPACLYKPKDSAPALGDYSILKSGKSGLSQTNLEDANYAISVLKFIETPAVCVMKHLNPSGVAMALPGETLKQAYIKARESDPRAAFGGVAVFNKKVDKETAEEIMQTIIEMVVAPDYEEEALNTFNDFETFKRNKEIRIIKIGDMASLEKYIDDPVGHYDLKMLLDGSLVVATPFRSRIKSPKDFIPAFNEHKKHGRIEIKRLPTEEEKRDLVLAWWINCFVRSNGVVIVKNGGTLAVGTGEQDRVGAVEQAILKAKDKYKGAEGLKGAVLSSDGFFPFRDSIDLIAKEGISAVCQPGGSVSDYAVIEACNEHNIAMVFTDERCFSHH